VPDEGQQRITALLGVVTESPIPHLVEEEAPISKHVNILVKNKNMIMGPDVARNQE
jgi:hypothetical protein